MKGALWHASHYYLSVLAAPVGMEKVRSDAAGENGRDANARPSDRRIAASQTDSSVLQADYSTID